jgi:mRNA interferase RelE/StbE
VPKKYRIELLGRKTRQELDRIREPDLGRITEAILKLEEDPRPRDCRKLRGLEGWRIRVGDWRVLYHVDDQECIITIVSVRRRRLPPPNT